MGRWTDDGEGTVFLSPEKNIVLQSRSVAGHFTDNHNADCDAYEQRIAELEAELARVKAESLRVVKDGEVCAIMDCDSKYFIYNGRIYEIPDGEFYGVLVGHEGPHYTGFYGDSATIVQPIRLERWDRPC